MATKKIDGSELNEGRATRFGYMGLFAHRDSLREAMDDAMSMIEGSYPKGERGAAMTALMITINTYALLMAEQRVVVNELRELARATEAYCIQDSRSSARRAAMIQEAGDALVNAQDVFGDED